MDKTEVALTTAVVPLDISVQRIRKGNTFLGRLWFVDEHDRLMGFRFWKHRMIPAIGVAAPRERNWVRFVISHIRKPHFHT